jgi:hypothetical protein
MAAAAYALLTAVCTLTSGAPSIRSIAFVTPDSSTTTTVTGTDIEFASATAASTITRDTCAESVGRIADMSLTSDKTASSIPICERLR